MSDRSVASRPQSANAADRPENPDLVELAKRLAAFGGERGQAYKLAQDEAGRLVVIAPDGTRQSFPGTEALTQALAGRLNAFAEELRMQQVDIDRVLSAMERQRVDEKAWAEIVFRLDRLLADIVPRDGQLSWRSLGKEDGGHDTPAFDAGKIGRGIGHLPTLPSENMLYADDGRRLTELARIDSNDTDPRTESVRELLGLGGVGSALTHLPPMPDGARNVIVDPRVSTFDQRRGTIAPEQAIQQPQSQSDRYSLREDGQIAGRLLDNDTLPNGHQDLKLDSPPPPGQFELKPDGSFTYVPPANFSGTIELTYSFMDGRTGLRVTDKLVLVVEPVADAPVLTGPAAPLRAEEDTPVTLTGLSGRLSDRDGSEADSYRIEGVPAGATFSGKGLDLGNGVWAFTAAELAGPVVFVPPANQHGTYNLTLVGVSREGANGDTAESRLGFSVVIDAQVDTPILTTGTTRFNEDAAGSFGSGISYSLVDKDGSEAISAVTLSGFPAGVAVTYSVASGASVSLVGGVYTITGSAAAIRATLDSFAAQQSLHGDRDFAITVGVTARDADGSTVSVNGTHRLIVNAVADMPTVSGSGSGNEDGGAIAVPVTITLTDTDGSETLTRVEIGNVPTGATLGWNTALPGTVTALGGGLFRFEGTQAEIQSLLATLTLVPPLHSDADIALSVAATVTETAPSEAGGVAVQTATRNATVTVAVTAVADAPVVVATPTAGEEDTALAFGAGITMTKPDSDGSESISRVEVGGLPGGWTLGWNTALAGTVTLTAGGAVITGTEAEIRALVASLTATPPLNSDADATLTIAVTTRDNDGSTATTTVNQSLTVDAQADAPVTAVTPQSVNEDNAVNIGPSVTWTKPDNDGSEWVSRVEFTALPAGWTATIPPVAGVTVTGTAQTGLVFTIASQASEAALRTAINGLTLTPPANSDADYTLSVRTTTTDADGSTATGAFADMVITVAPVSDQPTVTTTPLSVVEDNAITVGTAIGWTKPDNDGSERISRVEVTGFGTSSVTWSLVGTASVVAIAGGYAITAANEADLRATLDSLAMTPPANSDADLVLTVRAQTTDGTAAASAFGTNTLAVTVTPSPDAPLASVGAGNFNTAEDVAVALTGLSGTRTDTDGSETLTYRITGVPAGASFNRGTDLGGGVWSFSQADITAGLSLTPPTNYSGTINLVLQVISTEADGGASATTTAAFTVTVGDAADLPSVPATSSTVDEDANVVFGTNITYALTDNDGSEVISKVAITGVPAGSTVTYSAAPGATVTAIAGGYEITGTQAAIRATVDSFALTPPANRDANIALTVAVTSRELDNATATTNGTHTIVINARADAVNGSGSGSGNEDTAIATPITVTLTDTDGSESLAHVDVSGVPAGGVLGWNTGLPGSVTNPVAGTWRFSGTTAQIQALLASVTVTPPSHSDAEFSLSVTARSTESTLSEAGEVTLLNRDTSFTVPVTVTAVADQPNLTNTPVAGNEDTAILIGPSIAYSLVDTDGSETITSVALSNFPVGSAVTWTVSGGAVVDTTGGIYTITGTPAEIRATLDSVRVQQALNSDADFTVTVAVSVLDHDGSTATRTGSLAVTVNAVSDAPTLAATTVAGEEDSFITFGNQVSWTKPDNDGSEVISRVEITGFGASTAQYTAAPGATVTAIAGGYAITGTEAAIRTTLDSFAVRQALHSDADLSLTIRAQTTDGVAAASTFASITQTITVDAQADAPTTNVTTQNITEDVAKVIGTGVTWVKPDNDGSEWVSRVEITALPAGWTTSFTPNAAVTITGTALTGFTLSIAAKADEAALRAVLDSFTVTPPLNSDADYTLSFRSTTTDADGSVATGAWGDMTLSVAPVSDAPTLATNTVAGEEDSFITFGNQVSWTKPDNDGSEVISRVEITGFGASTAQYTAAPGATVTAIAGGYAITGTEAAIRTTLDSFAVRQALHSDADLSLTIRAQTTDGVAAASTFASITQTITVDAQADAPTLAVGAISGNEDTPVTFGNAITWTKPDNDGSEWVSQVTLTGFPTSWAVTYTPNAAVTVTGDSQSGYTLSIAAKADETALRNVLNSFAVQAPLHSDADATIQATATTTDADGSTAISASVNVPVTIVAVADTPSSSAVNATGNEDTWIPLTLSTGLSPDADGSETLSIRITGVPTGASFSAGTNAGGGVWTFTQADLVGLQFRGPTQLHGAVNMSLIARSTESSNGNFAESTSPFTVTLNPILDPIDLVNSTQTVNEDATIAVGTQFGINLVDLDGSQNLTYTISGIPIGFTVNRTLMGGTTFTDLGGGSVQFSGTNANDVINSIRTMTLSVTPAGARVNRDSNFTLSLSASTAENSGGGTSTDVATHAVTVRAVADQPNQSFTPPASINEDTSPISFPVTATLADTDGSEVILRADVQFMTWTGTIPTLMWNTGLPGTVSGIANGQRFSGTTAQIQALLASMSITPQTHNGSDFTVRVIVTSRESNPTEAGDVATLTATRQVTYTFNMVPVADQPNVTAPGIGSPFLTEEDTNIQLTGLGGSLVDTDGSETLSYQIRNVPTGASFTSGTNLGGGVWSFTAAQIAAGPTFVPPAGSHGTYDLTLRAIATETENANTAFRDGTIRIVVDAQADTPNLSGSSTVTEDTATTIGTTIVYSLNDNDGSEYIDQITVSGLPAGWSASFPTTHASVTITGDAQSGFTLSIASAANAANLRAVLDSLRVTPPANSDTDASVTVTARSRDADGSTATQTATHTITVRANADAPGATGNDVAGNEDTVIALSLSATSSVDADGSETLSARILGVPTGATLAANLAGGGALTNNGDGSWSITAPTTAQLNAILGSMTFNPPANLHGVVSMQLEVTATETAVGGQVATKTAVTLDNFSVTLTAVADMPVPKIVAATGGAGGLEDTPIPLAISANIVDNDGSQVLSFIIADVPAGASFVNAGGTPIGTLVSPGVYSFTAAEVASLRIIPPLNSSDDFTLQVTVRSTEVAPGNPGNGDFREVTVPLPVQVKGVADLPNLSVTTVTVAEDTPIPFGSTIVSALTDTDGSEVLFYVISGLPAGVVPSAGTYIGGEWQIAAADIATVTIPAVANFSGNYTTTFAPNLKVRAVSQEADGDQVSREANLNIVVTPVMDAFPGWSPNILQHPEDTDIPLSSAAFSGLPDNDGSEQIDWYEFNLSGLVASAQIATNVGTTQNLINNFIAGTYTDMGGGIIRVQRADLAGVRLMNAAFRDSNVDFTIPVTAHVTEAGGLTQNVSGTFSVDLRGVADVPTAYAQNVAGITGQLVRINPNALTGWNLGGEITDTDVAQGRTNSERIYYIISGLNSQPGLEVGFFKSDGTLAGLNNNDGTWYLTRDDLVDLHIVSRYGQTGTLTMSLTVVTEENDNPVVAVNAAPANFTASFAPDSGGSGGNINPLPPIVTVNPMSGNEDSSIVFTVNVAPAPGDPSPITPSVSLLISNVPAGATVIGATLNPSTGRYIATAADLAAGTVRIIPPLNFSGTMNLVVEAVSMNTQLNTASTGPQPLPVTVVPVSDGPVIAMTPAPGTEDTATALNLSVTPRDLDASSPEVIQNPIRITVSDGATLSAGTALGGGVYELTQAQLAGLTITPAANWHGPITVSVQATAREPGNGATSTSTSNFTVNVGAVPDAPTATVANVSGNEDTTIALTGLSAALVDTDGSERLSVKIFGIPEGSILSAGGNNGDGSWTIPVASLATLTIKPPKDYSGTMNLTLEAYALEANGQVGTTTRPFTVTVNAQADTVTLNAQNVSGTEDAPVALNLGLALEDRNGTNPGENPAETVEITFTGMTAGASLVSTGGTLTQLSATSWRFTGTSTEAATLAYVGVANAFGTNTVNISARAIDGGLFGPAQADSFTVTTVADADQPTISAFTTTPVSDTALGINLTVAFPDNDGSETHLVRISGVPLDAALSAGTHLGGGVWQMTEAQLAGLSLTPGSAGSFTLTAEATATELSNNDSATSSQSTLTVVTGTSAANTLAGTAGADRLFGLGGNDTLSGGNGADTLTGGNGSDTLRGGEGVDLLIGGGGADRLVWAGGDTGTDIVQGFSLGENDVLDVAGLITGFNPGVTPVSDFVRFTEAAGNTTVEIAPTGAGAFTMSIAVLQGVTGLNADLMRTNGNLVI